MTAHPTPGPQGAPQDPETARTAVQAVVDDVVRLHGALSCVLGQVDIAADALRDALDTSDPSDGAINALRYLEAPAVEIGRRALAAMEDR